MANFRFTLETVLRLRESERDVRLAELAKAHRAEAILREQQSRLAEEAAEARRTAHKLSTPGQANVDGLLQMYRYGLLLKLQSQQLSQQMAQVQAETERRRLAVVEADRQVRVLEKLRQRQAAAHRVREEKRETKELDAVAVLGYSRAREDES